MFTEGDKVIYTGKNYSERSKKGVCVSGMYNIQEWTFINVQLGAESVWHPINIENLEHMDLTKRFDMIN